MDDSGCKQSKRTIKSTRREIFVYPERVFHSNGNQSASEQRTSKGELISATRSAIQLDCPSYFEKHGTRVTPYFCEQIARCHGV